MGARFGLLLFGFAALTACGGRAVSSTQEDAGSDDDGVGSPSVDATVDAWDAANGPDAADSGSDAAEDVTDGGPYMPAECDGGTVYNDMGDPSFWSTYATGIQGPGSGTFDGRYVYFASNNVYSPSNPAGVVTRYDTRADFATASSWTTFDATTLDANAIGFYGTASDGRYAYFVPSSNGVIVRYDTQAAFAAPASWSAFDIVPTGTVTTGFAGAVFDGRYLYVFQRSGGVIARYDTHAAFAASSSWTTYSSNANFAEGGVFDGRYVYIPTFYVGLIRYDTQGTFAAASSWATNSAPDHSNKSNGLAFDGRYVYTLSPNDYVGYVFDRFDTTADFMASTSWSGSTPQLTGSSAASGAAFDGRYVYVVPGAADSFNGTACCRVVRYDTQMPFQPSAWSAFDTTTVNPATDGFHGAVFDGRYVYLIPIKSGLVARFDAKTPPCMPNLPAWNGSFF